MKLYLLYLLSLLFLCAAGGLPRSSKVLSELLGDRRFNLSVHPLEAVFQALVAAHHSAPCLRPGLILNGILWILRGAITGHASLYLSALPHVYLALPADAWLHHGHVPELSPHDEAVLAEGRVVFILGSAERAEEAALSPVIEF